MTKLVNDQVGFIPGLQNWFNITKLISITHQIDRLKDKNHVRISRDAKEAFDDKSISTHDKTLSKLGTQGKFFPLITRI